MADKVNENMFRSALILWHTSMKSMSNRKLIKKETVWTNNVYLAESKCHYFSSINQFYFVGSQMVAVNPSLAKKRSFQGFTVKGRSLTLVATPTSTWQTPPTPYLEDPPSTFLLSLHQRKNLVSRAEYWEKYWVCSSDDITGNWLVHMTSTFNIFFSAVFMTRELVTNKSFARIIFLSL